MQWTINGAYGALMSAYIVHHENHVTHSTLCILSLSLLYVPCSLSVICSVLCCLVQVPLGLIEATEVFGAKDKLLVLCRDARTFRSAQTHGQCCSTCTHVTIHTCNTVEFMVSR